MVHALGADGDHVVKALGDIGVNQQNIKTLNAFSDNVCRDKQPAEENGTATINASSNQSAATADNAAAANNNNSTTANNNDPTGTLSPDEPADRDECYLNAMAVSVISSFFCLCDMVFQSNMKYIRDYRMVIQPTNAPGKRNFVAAFDLFCLLSPIALCTDLHRMRLTVHLVCTIFSLGKKRGGTHILSFWCLNPAVSFASLGAQAHSILLCSGTLKPFDSFQSELGIQFASQFEGKHIIQPSQLWAGTIPFGMDGTTLLANYQNIQSTRFQDSIG